MDIIKLLESEHQRALALVEQVEALGASVAKDTILEQLILELTVHERAEEAGVWSALRELLPDPAPVELAIAQETDMKQVIQILLETMDGERLETQVLGLRDMVLRHVITEQQQIFPLVMEHVDEERRRQMSVDYIRAKSALMVEAPHLNVTMVPESRVEETQER